MLLSKAGFIAIFLFVSIAVLLVGIYMLIYAAHCFLSVLVGTASGGDEIGWPDDVIVDWLWKSVYLTWLFSVWAVPSFFLVVSFGPDMGPGLTAGLVVGLAWLCYPISLLSAQSSENPWTALVSPEVLRRLGYHVPAYV